MTPNPDSAVGQAKEALAKWNGEPWTEFETNDEEHDALLRVTEDLGDALTELVARIERLETPAPNFDRVKRYAPKLGVAHPSHDWLVGAGGGIAYVIDLLYFQSVKEVPP